MTSLSNNEYLEEIAEQVSSIHKILADKKDDPLTLKDAAKYLGFSTAYLYKLTSLKQIPHYKPHGKMIYFIKADLDKWLFNKKSKVGKENE